MPVFARQPRRNPSVSLEVELRPQSNRQRLELVGEPRLDVLRGVGYLHVGKTRERLLDEDPQLEARKRSPQAEVPAAGTERLVLRIARDVEAVGILVASLVAIRGRVPHHQLL